MSDIPEGAEGQRSSGGADSVLAIERPDPRLLKYYFVVSLALGPFFPFALLPRFLKYRTLRYSFDREGVAMRWGALHHREIRLNYARLQDIHLSSNLVERWFDLSKVQLQTASGSAKPEMTLEGILDSESVRDFLYRRMHGVDPETVGWEDGAGDSPPEASGSLAGETSKGLASDSSADPIVEGLAAATEELAAIRRLVEARLGRPEG